MSRIQVFTGFLTSLFTSIIKAFRGKFQPAVTLLLLDACVPWVCAFMQPRVSGLGLGLGLGCGWGLGLGLGLGKGLTVGRRMRTPQRLMRSWTLESNSVTKRLLQRQI